MNNPWMQLLFQAKAPESGGFDPSDPASYRMIEQRSGKSISEAEVERLANLMKNLPMQSQHYPSQDLRPRGGYRIGLPTKKQKEESALWPDFTAKGD